MTGLLKNNFYGALESGVIFLAFFLVAGLGVLISGDAVLLNILILVPPTSFAISPASSFRKEASTKWNKYELTAPVRRKDIVKSRYINHVLWVLIGIATSAVFAGLMLSVHGNRYFHYGLRDILLLSCASLGTSLFMGAIFYPVTYLLGADKSEAAIIIGLLGAVGLTAGTLWLMNAANGFQAVSDPGFYLCLSVFTAIAIVFFLLSYFLSVFIYRGKEY